MDKILIDTDVILDFFFDRKPFSEDAAKILSLCEAKKVNGYLTPVIFSNTYYLLHQTASHRKVIDKLKRLLSIIDVVLMDKTCIFQALNSEFSDFEDALQNYAALQSKFITIIITRNVKDYKKSTLSVLTPEIFLKSYKNSNQGIDTNG